jgi:hypothetical protein
VLQDHKIGEDKDICQEEQYNLKLEISIGKQWKIGLNQLER